MSYFLKSLSKAVKQQRVAHLCIDNQAYYAVRDQSEENFSANFALCEKISDTTNKLADYIQTIHVNYYIGENNFKKYGQNPLFEPHNRIINYDADTLKASLCPTSSSKEKIQIDYINPQFLDHHCFIKNHCDAFNDGKLHDFLVENKKDVLLISGCYLTSCIKASIEGAMDKHHYKEIILLDDCVLDYPDKECTVDNMVEWQQNQTQFYAHKWGLSTMNSQPLIQHLKAI